MNRQGLFTRAVTALTGTSLLASCGLWPGSVPKQVGTEVVEAAGTAGKAAKAPTEWVTLNQPVIREKMDYTVC